MLAVVCYTLMALAVAVSLLNWAAVLASLRLRRQGGGRHISTVALVNQILLLIAALISEGSIVSYWLLAALALTDPALYGLLRFFFFALRNKLRGSA
jgi:uncharacterized membrane protein YobD (UPF0266 family)